MTTLDWRSPEAYARFETADAADLAWEFLRRHPDYRKHYDRWIEDGKPDAGHADFRRQWGLIFRR